jgi:cation transport regulator ChaB
MRQLERPQMKADIYKCTWASGWTQYHDDDDPMPDKWDDDPPEEVAAFVLKIEAEAEIDRLRVAMTKAVERAKVFDDGTDGADGESAKSVVGILSAALAA